MDISVTNDAGLICGFWLGPVESCDIDTLKAAGTARPYWLHFNLADVRARRWLQEESGLPAAAIKNLTEPDPRVQLDVSGESLHAVLGDLHHDFDRDPEGFGKLRLYLDADRMITVRRDRLRTADRVRRNLMAGDVAIDTPAALFAYIVQQVAITFREVITNLGDEVDKVEDEILVGRVHLQSTVLGRVRRNIARLRRHMNANRAALSILRGHIPPVLEGQRAALRQTIEQLETSAQDLELTQERTRLLQEEIASRLGEATNRNLFLLSTVTTALLPITLITGIFGMNVGGVPGVGDPHGFRGVMMVIIVTVMLALFLIFRRRNK